MVIQSNQEMPFFGEDLIYKRFKSTVGFETQILELAPLKPADAQYQLRRVAHAPHPDSKYLSLLFACQYENAVGRARRFPDIEKIIDMLRKPLSDMHVSYDTALPLFGA